MNDEQHLENDQIRFDGGFLKLSGKYAQTVRLMRAEFEEFVMEHIRKMDPTNHNDDDLCDEKFIAYHRDFLVDKLGLKVKIGETAITEGWKVPKYENEYQNLLGLPFTEDNAATLKIKRPPLECFNCLATNHRIQDCPIRIDEDRVAIHKKIFNFQSAQAHEQAQLWSNRYIGDHDAKKNRGFTPGKISSQLREALCLRSNQLPPFIYYMRKYGYPIGWLLEAEVKKPSLTVLDGVSKPKEAVTKVSLDEDGEIENERIDETEHDPDLILTFPGFNEPVPDDFIDESDKYRVPRYTEEMSRENFLKTLKLKKKKQIGRRSIMDSSMRNESNNLQEQSPNDEATEEVEEIVGGESNRSMTDENNEVSFSSPKQTLNNQSILGESLSEIQGTPIVEKTGSICKLPDFDKFSDGICAHKAYEMDAQTPVGGSYKNIVKLTREFKMESNNSIINDDNTDQ